MNSNEASEIGMQDVGPVEHSDLRTGGPLARLAFLLGSAGLALATVTDALAVAGRRLGFPVLGSIEIVQAAIVLIASAAIVGTTVAGGHAAVHIVTQRLPERTADRLLRAGKLISAILFVLIAIGSAWVARDLWSGSEQTELLHIPLRWLRLFWIATLALIAGLFFVSAFRKSSR